VRGRSFLLTSHQLSRHILLGVFVALALTMPAYAVKNVKISNYGNGHQLWFEAEAFDERNPNTPDYSPVVDQDGAFGKAVGRTGAAGGMMRWTFDISLAGGKGGTWYFWGRVLNPNNRSDYLLIEGDPQGPPIPAGPSFPAGDGTAPFVNTRDRIFEATVSAWGWARSNHPEGHTKQLQDGENNMYIFRREGTNATVFWDVFMWTDDPDYVPTDDDYRNAMVPVAGTASNPTPGAGATDVPRDAALSWTGGPSAGKHDVYFGTDMAAVTQATAAAEPAGVYQGRVDSTTYTLGLLANGQTYYWRVDEVNQAPNNNVVTGTVWSFTVEPYSYRIKPAAATASSAAPGMGPEKTIDGSGLTGDLHGVEPTTMWMSTGVLPNWIQYEFDQVYQLESLQVWNSNQLVESFVGWGAKNVVIETSADGATWAPVANVPEFAQAPGAAGYAANTTINLGPVQAKYVKLTINTTWGGLTPQAGLSEVRFSYVPVQARLPQPASAAQGVGIDTSLDWRPGRGAASHQVYFGTDATAVTNATAAARTVAEHGFVPDSLLFGTTYYWRVDEVNTVTYPGPIWSFTTQEYVPVDDFESYTDKPGEEIFSTWIDGFTSGASGSTVGYLTAAGGTFGETAITHGGKQAMPFEYNNVKTPYYSEAERTFDTSQDWTAHGADTLTLYFRGNPPAFAEAAGTITMSGSGTDIWDVADQFRFACKSLTGDGTLVAKVESVGNTDPWAKAGVMIRESLDPGARFAAVYATPGNGVRYQARTLNAGAATSDTSVATAEQMALQTPIWIKVERKGSSFSCYYSADGAKWTTMSWDPQTINMMTGPIYIGLAVTSHNATATTTAVFSNVATTGSVTGSWQVQAIGVAQPANDAAPLYLVVQDSAGKSRMITHPDPAATTLATWQQWRVPLSDLTGIKLTAVKKLTLGAGDRANPKPGGAGKLFIDDIGVGHPAATKP
jgi:hypothetical protein